VTSPIWQAAIAQWRQVRADFEIHREAAFRLASDECHGVLLNARGKKAGIEPYSLFIGSDTKAYAYASDELKEHWARRPRITYETFEKQSFEAPPEQAA
jgi:hypothetical protein